MLTFKRFESLRAKTMLSGFKSRWTTRLSAKNSQPLQICTQLVKFDVSLITNSSCLCIGHHVVTKYAMLL